ncbi:hypothetical protein RAJCM14343_4727 [Rhodococcus aetherivorans]|uniref:Transposase n=1 Tax=Rhodococcus aetherivorans TaxID=191292 RepID=A0ABQ0YS63_9NOCA|nr:hypothetical protein RAJCM14343_4727 [Rhodococcus aetherivorans]
MEDARREVVHRRDVTSRYDRARGNLDRHGNYVLAAYLGGAA